MTTSFRPSQSLYICKIISGDLSGYISRIWTILKLRGNKFSKFHQLKILTLGYLMDFHLTKSSVTPSLYPLPLHFRLLKILFYFLWSFKDLHCHLNHLVWVLYSISLTQANFLALFILLPNLPHYCPKRMIMDQKLKDLLLVLWFPLYLLLNFLWFP